MTSSQEAQLTRSLAVGNTVVAELRRLTAEQRYGADAVEPELWTQLDATRCVLRAARIALVLLVVVLVGVASVLARLPGRQ